jgi:hypothetical protein
VASEANIHVDIAATGPPTRLVIPIKSNMETSGGGIARRLSVQNEAECPEVSREFTHDIAIAGFK